jgi:hypothetical protein
MNLLFSSLIIETYCGRLTKVSRNPSHSQLLHLKSGSLPSPFMQHPPTAYFSKSKLSGSGIPYTIFRNVPISEHPGHTKPLILLRRFVVMASQ